MKMRIAPLHLAMGLVYLILSYNTYAQSNSVASKFTSNPTSGQSDNFNFNSKDYSLKLLPFNSEAADFSPFIIADGLIFCSTRDRSDHQAKEDSDIQIYQCLKQEKGNWGPVTELPGNVNSIFDEGPIAIYRDGEHLLFCRKFQEDSIENVSWKIMAAELAESQNWISRYRFKFNSVDYSLAHPTISRDNDLLIFVSDMKNGYGGTDLYASSLVDGEWSEPFNLGPEVNSKEDEMFPSIHPDGTLYFSSRGHQSKGKLDIFKSNQKGGVWQKPDRLPSPFNSREDDFGLVFASNYSTGYFTSSRGGGRGSEDIYVLTNTKLQNKNSDTNQKRKKEDSNSLKKDKTSFENDINQNQNSDINEELEASSDLNILKNEDLKGKKLVKLNRSLGLPRITFTPTKELSEKSKTALLPLVEFLLDNPDERLFIIAHCAAIDLKELAKTSTSFQASIVKNYLVSLGIDENNIFPKGYGDDYLLNNCFLNSDCTKSEHEINDRVDFFKIENYFDFQSVNHKISSVKSVWNNLHLIKSKSALNTDPDAKFILKIGPYKELDMDIFDQLNGWDLHFNYTIINEQEPKKALKIEVGPFETLSNLRHYESILNSQGITSTSVFISEFEKETIQGKIPEIEKPEPIEEAKPKSKGKKNNTKEIPDNQSRIYQDETRESDYHNFSLIVGPIENLRKEIKESIHLHSDSKKEGKIFYQWDLGNMLIFDNYKSKEEALKELPAFDKDPTLSHAFFVESIGSEEKVYRLKRNKKLKKVKKRFN